METKYKYIGTAGLALIVGFMISLGVDLEVDSVAYDQGYLPYSCDKETVEPMMCYKLSRLDAKTGTMNRYCYYNRDKSSKYKVCSTGWERIINTDDLDLAEVCPESPECKSEICPENDCSICPKEKVIEYVDVLCVQTCNGCGGGSSKSCPPKEVCANCDEVSIISYIPNDDCTAVDKYFCDKQGYDASCVKDGDLQMPFNW